MIELGGVALHDDESSTLTRMKLLGLLRDLQAGEVLATRIATGVSELSRHYTRSGGEASCRVFLDRGDTGLSLAIRMEGPGNAPDPGPLRLAMDTVRVERSDPHVISAAVRLPRANALLDDRFIERQRARVQQRSRRELMDELREKNRQLEVYNEQLEHTVAERTAELRDANLQMRRDLDAGAEYVRRIIPAPLEGPVTIDWSYLPSSDLGGDTIGYHDIDEDHLAIYLVDVTGHGLDSALLAVTVTNVIRSGSLPNADMRAPDEVLAALNNAFPGEEHGNKYFTIWYGVYQRSTRRLRWSGGGHHPSLLRQPGQEETVELESSGLMMGVVPGMEFPSEEIELRPGATMVVFSDGLFEIMRDDALAWSYASLLDYTNGWKAGSGPLSAYLLDEAQRLQGNAAFFDDVSILNIRIDELPDDGRVLG